jgi:hypothetical protein
MSRKSIEQAKQFSWEKACDKLLAICREVAGKAAPTGD